MSQISNLGLLRPVFGFQIPPSNYSTTQEKHGQGYPHPPRHELTRILRANYTNVQILFVCAYSWFRYSHTFVRVIRVPIRRFVSGLRSYTDKKVFSIKADSPPGKGSRLSTARGMPRRSRTVLCGYSKMSRISLSYIPSR